MVGRARGAQVVARLAIRSAPAKLTKRGGFLAYRSQDRTFRGITRPLSGLYSGTDPESESESRNGGWRGVGGGLRRGRAVDSQVTRVLNSHGAATFALTKLVLSSLQHHGLKPVCAQRVVTDAAMGLATAADVVAVRGDAELVLVELKCGFRGDRTLPATRAGRVLKMKGPIKRAKDTFVNRHFAQLSATLAMFCNERDTLKRLRDGGIASITGAVLYADTTGSELFELPEWWRKRGGEILRAL